MKHKEKEKDYICNECGYVYPFKVYREYEKIHGFKYTFCFKCNKVTKHQTIDPIDLYKKELELKDYEDFSQKDKIVKRLINKSNNQ